NIRNKLYDNSNRSNRHIYSYNHAILSSNNCSNNINNEEINNLNHNNKTLTLKEFDFYFNTGENINLNDKNSILKLFEIAQTLNTFKLELPNKLVLKKWIENCNFTQLNEYLLKASVENIIITTIDNNIFSGNDFNLLNPIIEFLRNLSCNKLIIDKLA